MSSLRSLILLALVASAAGCVNSRLHGVPTKDAGATDATAEGAADLAFAAPAPVSWRPATVALPGGGSGLITLGKGICLLTDGHNIRVGSCDGEVTIGAAPARPQGPVENPDGDVNGNYNTGLLVRALGAVPITWDASGPPAAGYLYTDGAAVGSIPFPLPLDGGTLGICQGFTEAGAPSLVVCGNGDAGGITQITQDLLAGPGTGPVTGTVVGIQGRPITDAAPDAWESLVYSTDAGNWAPALVTLPNGVTGTLTVQLGGTGITDAGTAANLCLLTNGSGGFVVGTCTGSFTPSLDLAANPDGGAGQVLVAKHGNDGGQALTDYTQGWVVDPGVRQWGVTMQAPLDAAAAPASIYLTPGPPNASAVTTSATTPGNVTMIASAALGSGTWPGITVVGEPGDGGVEVFRAGPAYAGPQGYIWLGMNGATPTQVNATISGGGGALGLNAGTSGYIAFNDGLNGMAVMTPSTGGAYISGLNIELPGIGFIPTVINPTLAHVARNGDTATTSFAIQAQNAYAYGAAVNKNGEPLLIQSGSASVNESWGIAGPVRMQLAQNTSETMVDAFEGSIGHRATCIGFAGTGCGSADIPNGDGPTIFATLTAPTTCGSNYGDIYTDPSTGKLSYCNRSGAVQTFDSLAAGISLPLSVPNGGTGQTSYGTAGQCLQSQGASNPTAWGSCGGGGGGCNSVGATTGDVSISSPASCGGSVVTQVDSLTGSSGVVSFVGNGSTAEMSWPSGTTPYLYYSGSNNFTIQSASGSINIETGGSSPIALEAGTYTQMYSGINLEWYAGGLSGQPTFGALYSGLVTPSASNYALAASSTNTSMNAVTQDNLVIGGTTIATVTSSQVTFDPSSEIDFEVNSSLIAKVNSQKFVRSAGARDFVQTKTGNYQVLATDNIIYDTSNGIPATLTLPPSPSAGDEYTVCTINTLATTTLSAGSGQTVNGSASLNFPTPTVGAVPVVCRTVVAISGSAYITVSQF